MATKKQLDSDSDAKCATVQFYDNSHNSQSDLWIALKFYVASPDTFSYLGLTFQSNRTLGRHSFFLKDVTTIFGNLLVLQRSLVDRNIVSKCGKDS
jgi:hypothetical protein